MNRDDRPGGKPAGVGETSRSDRMRCLLDRVGHHDSGAFAELYELSNGYIYHVVLGVLRDREYSRDVTQDTLLQVWETAETYDPRRGTPQAWMSVIARRRAVDRVRTMESAAAREARYQRDRTDVPSDEVAESVARRLDAEAVVGCLQQLTPVQYEGIVLTYFGGLSYREAALRLGVAVPTFKSRMRSAIGKLRRCLYSTGEM